MSQINTAPTLYLRPRFMSIYRWLAITVLVLVVLVPLMAISLVGSETGSRWILTQGQNIYR